MSRSVLTAKWRRPATGPTWLPASPLNGLHPSGRPGWQGNGGPHRGHPARALPYTLDIGVPPDQGALKRVLILGVFALYASEEDESVGTIGATLHILSDGQVLKRQNFLNGRHYCDGFKIDAKLPPPGDGTELKKVGETDHNGRRARIDLLTIDLGQDINADTVRFRDLGSASSFIIYDVFFEFEAAAACPFHPKSRGISLSELASIVRVGDRARFNRAFEQFEESVNRAETLDVARGQSLNFLAVVTSSALEVGGGREFHTLLLDAARRLEQAMNCDDVPVITRDLLQDLHLPLFSSSAHPTSQLVDRALTYIDRNYARELSDDLIAAQLGLSTSHFRHIFRKATGLPFNKYLSAVRLEKAKIMLVEQQIPVGQIAEAVGYGGLSHFSRAFASRFHIAPTAVRRKATEVQS